MMRKRKIISALLLVCVATTSLQSQLRESVRSLFSPAQDSSRISATQRAGDTLTLREAEHQLRLSQMNEMSLRMELEQLRLASVTADSLKQAKQKLFIDSLRSLNQGFSVIIGKDTLFRVYAKRGGLTAEDRAENFSKNISNLGMRYKLWPDSLYAEETEHVTDLMYGSKVIASFTDQDALWQNISRQELVSQRRTVIVQKLQELKEEHSLLRLGKRIFYFVLVLAIQYLLYRLTGWLYRKVKLRIIRLRSYRLKSFTIHDYELLDTRKQVRMLVFLANMTRYALIFVQLVITVPILFSIFPQTEDLALQIFSYLWNPVRAILKAVVNYIPNLFTICVIYLAIRYVVKGLKYLADEINSGKLKISGFYPDWAHPSYQIVRFLLYAFMIAMIYPYLPGSDSGFFQGISVFVGLIISLGSSTVIGNVIAGLVITYMRPFKIGDRIKLNDTTGNVIEKTPFVTRLRTPKNELVTIPNSFIMSSHTINYSSSARNFGLIIHSEVTISYDAPWRKVHQLLIDAAISTPGVVSEPEPFVLETSLSDFYPVYQINAYIHDADQLAKIYSDLHQNIQDKFNEAGVEIMSPHYFAHRDGNGSTIPKEKK